MRDAVITRSGGRCEAMIYIAYKQSREKILHGTWTRCFRAPVEVHHRLTRARGGIILDEAGETHHLIALCHQHHKRAHSPGGHENGLMLDGYVTSGADGRPVYQGSDQYLSQRYGAVDLPVVREEIPGDGDGSAL